MNLNMAKKNNLEDIKINIKFKLSALWTSVMFCYIYGDFFTLFVPGRIKNLMDGHSGLGPTTPVTLLAFAVLMTVTILMIFLSLVMKPKTNRLANISIGIFNTVIMILVIITSLDKWMMFYIYLAFLEIILTSSIVWQAWTWPNQKDQNYLFLLKSNMQLIVEVYKLTPAANKCICKSRAGHCNISYVQVSSAVRAKGRSILSFGS